MLSLLLVLLAVVFAILAIRSRRLITSALWLAGVSALCALLFYTLGAQQVAVIELSVGAGLVTVLLVFGISVAGDEPIDKQTILPHLLTIGLALLFILFLGVILLPTTSIISIIPKNQTTLSQVFWQFRGLDALLQVVVIFSGVLGLLGLLAETGAPLDGTAAREVSARRESDLESMTTRLQGEETVQK